MDTCDNCKEPGVTVYQVEGLKVDWCGEPGCLPGVLEPINNYLLRISKSVKVNLDIMYNSNNKNRGVVNDKKPF